MFQKKLRGKDLTELQKRNALVNEYILIAQAIELQKRVWLNEVIKKMGLDPSKTYEVDPKNGQIKELTTPQIKNEPSQN